MARCCITNEEGKITHIPLGETTLGRGQFLGVNDKKCSREQAKITRSVNGDVILTPLGVNPMTLIKPDGTQDKLKSGTSVPLISGYSFTLLPNQYRYQFTYQNADSDTEELDEQDIGTTEESKTKDQPPSPDLKRKAESPPEGTKPPKKAKITTRPRCPYGETCYRQNPIHKRERCHPGDPDWDLAESEPQSNSTPHSPVGSALPSPVSSPVHHKLQGNTPSPSKGRVRCTYAENCIRKSTQHKAEFSHPGDADYETSPSIFTSPKGSPHSSPVSAKHSHCQRDDFGDTTMLSTLKDISGLVWSVMGTPKTIHVLNSPHIQPSARIAAFDMDGTLITTKSGNVHPKDQNDWKWWSSAVKSELLKLISKGYKIVIITNQGGINKSPAKGKQLEGKVMDICKDLGYPLQVLMSSAQDSNRKPNTKMWDLFRTHLNGNTPVDIKQSFYIGDAAGRPSQWKPGKPKDFACTDRKFANNVGLKFQTPEEYFDKESPAVFEWDGIDPGKLLMTAKTLQPFSCSVENLVPGTQELIIMVGRPASGKSYFSKKYLLTRGYEWVNRDTLKTSEKCEKTTRAALSSGKSVVVDNTNPSKSSRDKFLAIAREFNVPCRCFVMSTKRDLADHLNSYRAALTGGTMIPTVAYHVWEGNYEAPELNEGFQEIKKIHFVPTFNNDEEKKLFLQRY